MAIYEGEWPGPAEWNIAATLTLEADGRFSYSEYWTCYMAATGGDASGSWSGEGSRIVLRSHEKEGALLLGLEPGAQLVGEMDDQVVRLGQGCVLRRTEVGEDRVDREASVSNAPVAHPVPNASLRLTAVSSKGVIATAAREVSAPPPVEQPASSPLLRPSAALSARIQSLIDALTPPERGVGLDGLCRRWNVLPLSADSVYLWGLRPDGTVLCIDHESFRQDGEEERDPDVLHAALKEGIAKHPELAELLASE